MNGTCCVAGCRHPSATVLDVRLLCRDHFFEDCYAQMEKFSQGLRQPGFQDSNGEAVRHYLAECSRQAADLAGEDASLSNLERARVLDVLLLASEVGSRLRRSLRKPARLAIRLEDGRPGRGWSETTETVIISQHGASVRCQRAVETGAQLKLVCAQTGRWAGVRVVWQQSRPDGTRELGLEFLRNENFWGLDWAAPDLLPDLSPGRMTEAN